MESIGMRELKQNPAPAVRAAAAGQRVVITDRGRPVAQMLPLSESPLADLRAAGLIREATSSIGDLPEPIRGLELSSVLDELRNERL